MDITNEQKQVMLSGILGDGSLLSNGAMSFNCSHKEYMEYKKKLLGDLCVNDVKETMNMGYKKAPIFSIRVKTIEYGKNLLSYTHQDIVNELDELGIALWLFDDGSRHPKNNFYNINTHALDRNIEEKVIIPFLNKWNVYPKILTETKKDGRVFSYLYVSKWQGAMELARMMRKIPIQCYSYKLVPVELEFAYFDVKDELAWKLLPNAHTRTRFIKDHIGFKHSQTFSEDLFSNKMQH